MKSRPTTNAVIRDQMRAKLQRPGGYEIYKRRNIIVEPVSAEIKHLRQFRQFLLRDSHQSKLSGP